MHFFDTYSEFYTTSTTGSSSNRLNSRYLALIESNLVLIQNKTILDIASHDGRWSFAAIKNGAKKVIGIEGRKYLVDNAIKIMDHYRISNDSYSFIAGDIYDYITTLRAGVIDTVFCFGFLYHTINHIQLLAEIKRLGPKYIILDTSISKSDTPIIELKEEDSDIEANCIRSTSDNDKKVLVGWPSEEALKLMLRHAGFGSFHFYDWHGRAGNWQDLEDYRTYQRVSLVATNLMR
jgi:hypothetical protein